ncbi:MAG: PBP1A family penicillin-binding protein, partial [Eubacteriales bacterium]|nr:PBP1A family penicillin-binding protein [Eubacteriales bacterium]
KLSAADSNRLPVSLSQIPIDLQHAVVAIEDERFYEHNGIDVKGILRAAAKAVSSRSLSEGASTITQQLLKNNVFTGWTTESTWLERITRKLQEQYLAVQIEKKIDKNVILENYLNTINLGAGCYGVQAASQQYFNKDVSQLTLSECVTLAGITQNPTRFNPIQNPEENAKRRKEVLQHMFDQGYIDKTQYDEVLQDDVYSRIQSAQTVISQETNTVYSYYEDELIDQVIKDLMNIKGYTKTQATNMVYSGGLSIYSTQDAAIQQILDEEYANEANFPANVQFELEYALSVTSPEGEQINYSKEMLATYFRNTDPTFDLLFQTPQEGQAYVDQYKAHVLEDGSTVIAERVNFAPQPQSSVSIIDQSTGRVLALVGGRGEKTASLTLNRATDTTRQPGSTFKIVSTYAPALDVDNMTLATTFMDEEYNYPDGSPVNNYAKTYGGETTIRRAIQESCNVVAVKCLEEVTPKVGLKYLDNFGFTTLAHGTESDRDANGNLWSDENLATALGGITNGVTNVELCAAYASIANGGQYIKPIYYTKILDHNGNILIENPSTARTVLKPSSAYLLTSAMQGVIQNGTGKMCQLGDMPVAGKTGTTEEYNDLWFVGYTPYYTCAIWSGYDYNEKIPEDQRDYHKVLWQKIMTRLHTGLPAIDFKKPGTVTETYVCRDSGLLPSNGCSSILEVFETGTEPTTYCYGHFSTYNEDEEIDPDNPDAALKNPTQSEEIVIDNDNEDNGEVVYNPDDNYNGNTEDNGGGNEDNGGDGGGDNNGGEAGGGDVVDLGGYDEE